MKFTKTGPEYIATTDIGTYIVHKSPFFTSQWQANHKSPRQNSPRVPAPHAFGTLREAKEWCIEDHEDRTN